MTGQHSETLFKVKSPVSDAPIIALQSIFRHTAYHESQKDSNMAKRRVGVQMKHLTEIIRVVFFWTLLTSPVPIWSFRIWASDTATLSFDQTHSVWTHILKNNVVIEGSRSRVNYSAIKKNLSDLKKYLRTIQSVSKEEFSRFNEKERLSFLTNAYNALTVKVITDHYPTKSIRDIGGLFSNSWKIKFFTLFGEGHSLDDIEHEMIRKSFNEPRTHFALVCASKGCPALRSEAYIAQRFEEQLENATHTFLRDPSRNRFDSKANTLYLSSIFKWYGPDFLKKFGSVKAFVAPRIVQDQAEMAAIQSDRTKIEYLSYDWSLNE